MLPVWALPVTGRLADGHEHLLTACCFYPSRCGCEVGTNDPADVPTRSLILGAAKVTGSCTPSTLGGEVSPWHCNITASGVTICLWARVSLCCDLFRS